MTAKIHYVGKLLQPGLAPQNCELVVEQRPNYSSRINVQNAAYTVDILDIDYTIVKETSTASIELMPRAARRSAMSSRTLRSRRGLAGEHLGGQQS